MNGILQMLFGKGTRGVQVINLSASLVWFVLLLLPVCGATITVRVPYTMVPDVVFVLVVSGISTTLSVIGFLSHFDRRQIMKSAGLIFGALAQAIIASNYVSAYPPFDPMFIVCSLLSTWFLLAVMYIAYIEGIHTNDQCD